MSGSVTRTCVSCERPPAIVEVYHLSSRFCVTQYWGTLLVLSLTWVGLPVFIIVVGGPKFREIAVCERAKS